MKLVPARWGGDRANSLLELASDTVPDESSIAPDTVCIGWGLGEDIVSVECTSSPANPAEIDIGVIACESQYKFRE